MATPDEDRLLTLRELAEYLGVSTSTVYSWRTRGEGPLGYRVGQQVRYRLSEVDRWLETHADRRPA